MTDAADRLYERVLVLRCQARDEAAFEEIVVRYTPRLRYYLRKMLGGVQAVAGVSALDAGVQLSKRIGETETGPGQVLLVTNFNAGKKGEDGSNKVAAKSLLPEVKKAQQDLGAKPIPDDGAPTRFTP